LSPSSLVIWSSARKKNEVCGLIRKSARPLTVFAGAIAKPFEPDGSLVPSPVCDGATAGAGRRALSP
jgi:hypothetical protein